MFEVVFGMQPSQTIKERVQKSRERRRRAGLKRVEVLVPEDKTEFVKAYAAELREGSESDVKRQVRDLIAEAYRRFHASCLDNIDIDPEQADFPDAAVVAAALMNRGNSEAFRLGRRIRNLIK